MTKWCQHHHLELLIWYVCAVAQGQRASFASGYNASAPRIPVDLGAALQETDMTSVATTDGGPEDDAIYNTMVGEQCSTAASAW